MGDIYRLFRLFGKLPGTRLKLAALYGLHVTGRRYLGVFLDPVLACNFRCRMCYFSDEAYRREARGVMSMDDYRRVAGALFRRTLKLQLGCGAEPTLYKELGELVRLAKQAGVPYVSMTTNGALLSEKRLTEYVEAGLDEITLSVHGTQKSTYEFFMVNGSFERFTALLADLAQVKARHPGFKVRINYTMNADNVEELKRLPELLETVRIDVLQLRPIQKIGEHTAYENFDLTRILELYDEVLLPVQRYCAERGIACLIPEKENLVALEEDKPDGKWMIQDVTYCYVSPNFCWKGDFDLRTDTFESYCRRVGWGHKIWRCIFHGKEKRKRDMDRTKSLNYKLK